MKNTTFKTNITCTGCIAKVTPVLNELVGENNWEVDLRTKEKKLHIKQGDIANEQITESLKQVGYKAELLEEKKESSAQ
jgi:copper chaperone